jgi:transposase-like protein
VGAVRNVLSDHLFDSMMHIKDTKAMWDHLNATYGALDVGKELYIMESFNDYKMVANKSVVEQAHEIQRLAKELELLKLSSSWRNFAINLKHKRQKISVENLTASLNVEEKALAKDNIEKGNEEKASVHFIERNHGKNKGKPKQPAFNAKQNTAFKKKKKDKAELSCFTCEELGHFAKYCPERADKKEKKKVNPVTASIVDDRF